MRAYFITMTILGVITSLTMVPDLALILAVLSFGLAAPLLILSPNFFVYGLCFLPVAAFGWRASAVSIVLIVTLALLPSWLERRSFAKFVESVTAVDVVADPTASNAPKVVALIEVADSGNFIGTFEMGGANGCYSFCEALLRAGTVEVVQVGFLTSESLETYGAYALEGGQIINYSQEVREADLTFWVGARSGQLAVGEANELTADTTILVEQVGRVTVTTRERGHGLKFPPLVRRTDVQAKLLNHVTTLVPAFGGLTSGGNDGGLSLLRMQTRSDGFTLWDVANDLGIPIIAYESPADRRARIKANERAEDNARRNAAFNYARSSVYAIYANTPHPDPSGPRPGDIRLWLHGLSSSNRPMTDTDRDIIRQILDSRDPRFATDTRWLFWRDDELAREFFPRLIGEFRRDEPLNDALIEPMLERLRFGEDYNEEFEKYSNQMRSIMEAQLARDPAGQYLGLVSAGYRFGIDERPFMDAFPTDTDLNALLIWIKAVCDLPTKKLSTYGDEVIRRVQPVLIGEGGTQLPKIYTNMFRFLVGTGREVEVRSILENAGINVDRTLEKNIFEGNWDSEALCRGTNRLRFRL